LSNNRIFQSKLFTRSCVFVSIINKQGGFNNMKQYSKINIFFLLILTFTFVFLSFCNSKDKNNPFSGNFKIESNGTIVKLNLNQKGSGLIKGTLTSSTGAVFKLEGIAKGEIAEGECKGDNTTLFFEAKIKEDKLILTLIEPDKNNKPDYTKTKNLVFAKTINIGEKQEIINKKMVEKTPKANQFSPAIALSNKSVGNPNWGYKIYIPSGWKYQKNGNTLILGHNKIAGAIFVFPYILNNINQVRNNLIQGISNKSMSLIISGSPVLLKNNILSANYTGIANGNRIKAKGFGTLSPYGGGAFILAITSPEKFSKEIEYAALTLTQGIRYIKTTGSKSNLMQHFAGTWKTSSRNTETIAVLYPNGRFAMRYSSSYSGNQGSWGAANDQNNSGRWTVRGNKTQGVLILTYSNGNQESINYQVHVEKGQTYWREYYFDGTLYWKE
jgi:hypothetical protein